MENTLDLDKPKGLQFADLVFEDTEIIPGAELPKIPESVTEKIETPTAVKVPKPTLDQLEFEDEDPKAPESGAAPVVAVDSRIEAIKSILLQRMERYGVEAEDVNIEEMTEEDLVNFEEQLDSAIIDSRWNSLKSVDKNVGKLLDFLENEGDPKDMVALFKEQSALSKIDISTEVGQQQMIKSYYKNILGWDEDKADKKIERLAASGSLSEEAIDIEEAYNDHYEKKQAEVAKVQQEKVTAARQREYQKKSVFESSLVTNRVPKRLADEYKQTAFGKGIIKGTNEEISILDYKIMQMQTNPDMFLKLVQFATDPVGYDAMILQAKKNIEVTENMKKGFQVPKSTNTVENGQVKPPATKQIQFKF